jgi:hypothetical protein
MLKELTSDEFGFVEYGIEYIQFIKSYIQYDPKLKQEFDYDFIS